MLVGAELEFPVVSLTSGHPAPPSLFSRIWEKLEGSSWHRKEFGVERDRPSKETCLNSQQAIVTDTGPTIELVTAPCDSISGVVKQFHDLEVEARSVLDDCGYVMLGCGVHPSLRAVPEDYYRYRTPRPAYDYAIRERFWSHWSIVNIAAIQEVIDVSFEDAPKAIRLLHRLSGLMNFVSRNDPDFLGDRPGCLSVRPSAWKEHVPHTGFFAADGQKVCVPAREICSWRDYLALLWEQSPMFLVGTKDLGSVYLPEHPTFIHFLQSVPSEGWAARALTGEETRVVPVGAHVAQTDWTYLGFARIRWKWREETPLIDELLEAWQKGDIESFLASSLEKVVIENRCNSTQQPGEVLNSLALVSGLLANLDDALELALSEPHSFWVSVLEASMTQPFDTSVEGREIPDLARNMVDLAHSGLKVRGEDDAVGSLSALYERIEDKCSPSERLLRDYRNGDIEKLVKALRV